MTEYDAWYSKQAILELNEVIRYKNCLFFTTFRHFFNISFRVNDGNCDIQSFHFEIKCNFGTGAISSLFLYYNAQFLLVDATQQNC